MLLYSIENEVAAIRVKPDGRFEIFSLRRHPGIESQELEHFDQTLMVALCLRKSELPYASDIDLDNVVVGALGGFIPRS